MPYNPNDGALRLRFRQIIDTLTKRRDDALIFIGVPPEDVADDDDDFLHDVCDFRLEQLEEGGYAHIGRVCDFDRHTPYGAHGLAHEIDIDFRRIPEFNPSV